MDALVLVALGAILLWAEWSTVITFDGDRYLRDDRSRPYGLRMIGAWIARAQHPHGNRLFVLVCVAGSAWILYDRAGLLAAALFLGLSCVRTMLRAPVLMDAPLMFAVIAAWASSPAEPWWWIAFGAILSAFWSERAPVLMSAVSLNPWFLVGLIVPAVLFRWTTPMEPLRAPIVRDLNWQSWLAPWGLALPGFLFLGPAEWFFVAVAYAQCAFATDRARLYQVAAPVIVIGAAQFWPMWAWPLVIAFHCCLPYRRTL